jgi:hypothetical protein
MRSLWMDSLEVWGTWAGWLYTESLIWLLVLSSFSAGFWMEEERKVLLPRVSFLSLSQNAWKKQFEMKEDLFWLMVSEVSVHSHLAPSFLGLSKSWLRGCGELLNCSPHGGQEAESKIGRVGDKIHPSKAHPQWPLSPNRLHLHKSIQLWTHQ